MIKEVSPTKDEFKLFWWRGEYSPIDVRLKLINVPNKKPENAEK